MNEHMESLSVTSAMTQRILERYRDTEMPGVGSRGWHSRKAPWRGPLSDTCMVRASLAEIWGRGIEGESTAGVKF